MQRIKYQGRIYKRVMAYEAEDPQKVTRELGLDKIFKSTLVRGLMYRVVPATKNMNAEQKQKLVKLVANDQTLHQLDKAEQSLQQYQEWMIGAKNYIPKLNQYIQQIYKNIDQHLKSLAVEAQKARTEQAVEVSRDALSDAMKTYLDARMKGMKLQPGTPKYEEVEQKIIQQMLADEENPPDPNKVMMRQYSVKYRGARYVPVDSPKEISFQGSRYVRADDDGLAQLRSKGTMVADAFEEMANTMQNGVATLNSVISDFHELGYTELAEELKTLKEHLADEGQNKLRAFQRKAEEKLADDYEALTGTRKTINIHW